MDPAQNVSEEEALALKEKGISEVKPMARPSLRLRFQHALLGCITIRHYSLANGRVYDLGRICPFCLKEYP